MAEITNRPARLPMRVNLGVALISFGKKINEVVMAAYMVYFYTNVLGIDPVYSSTMILLAKVWDIINDPMMGAIVDRTKNKAGGTCRYYLKRFAVPMGMIVFLSLWLPDLSNLGTLIWVTVSYVLYGMISTACFIPVNTMVGRITSDKNQRGTLIFSMNVGALIVSLSLTSITMPLVERVGGGDMRLGFAIMAAIYGAMIAVSVLLGVFLTRGYEPVSTHSVAADGTPHGPTLLQALNALRKNHVWLCIALLTLLNIFTYSIEQTMVPFYFQYNFTNGDIIYPIYSTCSMGVQILPLFIFKIFVKKIGTAYTASLGGVMCVIGYGLRFLLHDGSLPIMALGWCIAGFGSGLASAVMLLNTFDARVYGHWKTGVDNDAIVMSGNSAATKIGTAIGGPIAGYMLAATPGYVAGAATQIDSVKNLFFIQCTLIPTLAAIIPTVLYFTVIRHNEKRVPQMEAEIAARKKAQADA